MSNADNFVCLVSSFLCEEKANSLISRGRPLISHIGFDLELNLLVNTVKVIICRKWKTKHFGSLVVKQKGNTEKQQKRTEQKQQKI